MCSTKNKNPPNNWKWNSALITQSNWLKQIHTYSVRLSPVKWAKTMQTDGFHRSYTRTYIHIEQWVHTKFALGVCVIFLFDVLCLPLLLLLLLYVFIWLFFTQLMRDDLFPSLAIVIQSFDCSVQNRMDVCESLDLVRLRHQVFHSFLSIRLWISVHLLSIFCDHRLIENWKLFCLDRDVGAVILKTEMNTA